MALFAFKNLSFQYPEGTKLALDGVDCAVDEGEFIVLCGKSGCGKSTLLRHLKSALTPYGHREGEVWYHDKPLEQADLREQASNIGVVSQRPDNQIVTDKVWHELAFGLESLGFDNKTIRLRVAEMASYFGIQQWYEKPVAELSGGQKQLLNLAAVMAMQPEVLILDEPTSQLDPIAASDFLSTIKKINNELGTTVILSEHRLEEALPLADRVMVMDEGQMIAIDAPGNIGYALRHQKHPMLYAMPTPMRVFLQLEQGESRVRPKAACPVTVREGKAYLASYEAASKAGKHAWHGEREKHEKCEKQTHKETVPSDGVIRLKDVWFRYEKHGEDVVRDLSLSVQQGELYCLVGGNGTGKTTSLGIISGTNKPYRGKVELAGLNVLRSTASQLFAAGLGVLPQDPQCLFLRNTLLEDLQTTVIKGDPRGAKRQERIDEIAELTEITDFLHMHPYDVSGGEQQRAALAKVLLTGPRILLMDEPTKGMDSFFKQKFARVLGRLQASGVTILMVSHDIEFCAVHASRCALFFNGSIVSENEPRRFFAGNSFYTTAANRMSRHMVSDAVTVEDVVRVCKYGQ